MLSFREFGALHENFTTARAKFIADGGEPSDVDLSIAHFRKIQQKLKGDERDIDKWAVQGWDAFNDAMNFDFQLTNKDQITLRDDDKWLIVVPLNHYTSCFYGKSTPWCVTKPNQAEFSRAFFSTRSDNIFVFCIEKSTKIMWALEISRTDGREGKLLANVWNNKNNTVEEKTFETETGLSVAALLATVEQNISAIRNAAKENAKYDIQHLVSQVRNTNERNPRLEQAILKNKLASVALDYIQDAGIPQNDKFIEAALPFIATDSQSGAYYAAFMLEKRFPAYEQAMLQKLSQLSKSPTTKKTFYTTLKNFVWYIQMVIGADGLPAAEPYISKIPEITVDYSAFTRRRFPDAEEGIIQDPQLARRYALRFIGANFKTNYIKWWQENAPELWNTYQDIYKYKNMLLNRPKS